MITKQVANVSMTVTIQYLAKHLRARELCKFCVVGASGVAVDMTVLHFLVSTQWCGWNLSVSKACSAEVALLSNFLWNEVWTFRGFTVGNPIRSSRMLRLAKFHAICGLGIGLAVLLLNAFYVFLGLNLYASNFLAIFMVTLWNFWMNAIFNWGSKGGAKGEQPDAKLANLWEDLKY